MLLSFLEKDHSDLLSLTMKDGNVIPYVSKCLHLGTTIYTIIIIYIFISRNIQLIQHIYIYIYAKHNS